MAVVVINSASLVDSLVFGIVCGAVCMAMALRTQRLKGVYPWGLHPAIWGVLGLFLSLIALILCIIARATTKAPPAYPGYGNYPPLGEYPGRYPAQGGYPAPGAYPGVPPPAPGAVPPAPGAVPPGTIPPATAPPSWLPDPLKRRELRYWDGTQWTEHVSDRGTQSRDPL